MLQVLRSIFLVAKYHKISTSKGQLLLPFSLKRKLSLGQICRKPRPNGGWFTNCLSLNPKPIATHGKFLRLMRVLVLLHYCCIQIWFYNLQPWMLVGTWNLRTGACAMWSCVHCALCQCAIALCNVNLFTYDRQWKTKGWGHINWILLTNLNFAIVDEILFRIQLSSL
jgi:hypothetical protein